MTQHLQSEEDIYKILLFFKNIAQFDSVFFAYDKTRKTYLSNGDFLDLSKNFDVSTRTWYKGAKEVSGMFVTDPYLSRSTGNNVIGYGIPVIEKGRIIGVVGGEYNLANYSKDVLAVGKSNNTYTTVYNDQGTIIFHEEAKLILKENQLSKNIANLIAQNPNLLNKKRFISCK